MTASHDDRTTTFPHKNIPDSIPLPDNGATGDNTQVLAAKLETAVGLSLDWCIDTLRARLPAQSAESFAPVLRAKGQAAQISMMLAAKTQEAALKKQALDRLPELIKLVQQHDKKLAAP